jgi:S1-C subfamily serine protease
MAPVRPQLPSASVGPQMFMLRMAGPSVYGGATLQPLDDDWRDNMGVQGEGVGVFEVPRGSPAEAWGLRKFDVIRQVNGENVTSIAVFARLVREPGAVVLTLSNRQGTRTVTIGR